MSDIPDNPYAQIAAGIVPDAVQPYNVQAEQQKKVNPYQQIAAGIQPTPPAPYQQSSAQQPYTPYSQGMAAQQAEEGEEPSYEPPSAPPKPKGSLEGMQEAMQGAGKIIQAIPGNVQHALQNEGFRQARRGLYGANIPGTEIPGGIARDISNLGMSAERAGKGTLSHPRQSAQAGAAGLASGAVGLIENPIAFGTNIVGGNYNQMVGGKPIQQRVLEGIGQGTEKRFPDAANVNAQVGGIAAAILAGGLAGPALEGVIGSLAAKLGIGPVVKVLDTVAARNPSLAYKLARGAGINMALNPAWQAGGKAAYGQPMGVTAKGEAEAGLLGAAGGAFAKETPRETVEGEVIPKPEPKRIGQQPLPKTRRISDVKQQEQGEPIVTPPPEPVAPEVPESQRLRTQPPVAAIEDIPPYRREALYPWQRSGYIPQRMAAQAVAPERARWNQMVQQAQQAPQPELPGETVHEGYAPEPTVTTSVTGQRIRPGQILRQEPQPTASLEAQAAAPAPEAPKIQPAKPLKAAKTPKPYPWENSDLTPAQQFGLAVDVYTRSKNEKTIDAAEAFIRQAREGKPSQPQLQSEQPQMGESQKAPAPEPQLQGRAEETAQLQEPKQPSRAEAMFAEAGVAPPRESEPPLQQTNPELYKTKATQYRSRLVPREDIEGIHQGENIDWTPGKMQVANLKRPIFNNDGSIRNDDYGNPEWRRRPQPTVVMPDESGNNLHIIKNVRTRATSAEVAKELQEAQAGNTDWHRLQKQKAGTLTPEEQQTLSQRAAEHAEETRDWQKPLLQAASKGDTEGVAKAAAKQPPISQEVATPLAGDPLVNKAALDSMVKDFMAEPGSAAVGYPSQAIGAVWKAPGKLWNWVVNDTVKDILSAKTSMDEIRKGAETLNDPLATKLWRNFGGEFIRSWGIKMTGEFGKEARRAMFKESINDILNPAKHPNWTAQQRKAVAWKKYCRLASRDLIDDFREAHEGKISPRLDRVLNDVHRGLLSPGERNYAGMNPWDRVIEGLGHAAYHSIFFLNPKTHLQILTHPWQTGVAMTTKGANPFSGPINIANAYRLLGTNKTFQTFMKGATSFTGENRLEATRDFMQKNLTYWQIDTPLSKLMERDFASGRMNNEVIGGAGLIKEYGEAKTLQLMHDVITGADWTKNSGLTFDEHADMVGKFLQTIHDATGSGTSGVSRTLLQSTNSGLGRAVLQMSGYTQQIARFYAGKISTVFDPKATFAEKLNASTQLGVMLSATTLMGGNAIPKSIKDQIDILLIKGSPELYLMMRKAEDLLNLPKQVPHLFAQATGTPEVLSTDMREHLSNSFINWAGNIGIEGLGSGIRAGTQLVGQTLGLTPPSKTDTPEMQLRKLVAGMMMGVFVDGIGGQSVSNLWKAGEMIGTGKKITTLYGANPFKRAGEFPIAKGVQKYTDLLDSISHAVHDELIPGRGYDESNWAIMQDIADKFKRAHVPVPWDQLRADYPTTITRAPK